MKGLKLLFRAFHREKNICYSVNSPYSSVPREYNTMADGGQTMRFNKLLSRSCAVCNSHSFRATGSYRYHAFQDKSISFLNIFLSSCALFISHCMSGSQDFVRFLRPVARQNGRNYTLRMILKIAYSIGR